MSKTFSLLMIFIILSATIATANASVMDKELILAQKDGASWIESGMKATMQYSSSGNEFTYSITGNVPLNEPYALIYYKDQGPCPLCSGNPWGLVGAVINGNIVPGDSKFISESGSVNIGTIPHSDDFNAAEGAKIWLVPASNLNVEQTSMVSGGWHPNNYLFEENLRDANNQEIPKTSKLITYTYIEPTPDPTVEPTVTPVSTSNTIDASITVNSCPEILTGVSVPDGSQITFPELLPGQTASAIAPVIATVSISGPTGEEIAGSICTTTPPSVNINVAGSTWTGTAPDNTFANSETSVAIGSGVMTPLNALIQSVISGAHNLNFQLHVPDEAPVDSYTQVITVGLSS